jgi:flagellar capping protein FliD
MCALSTIGAGGLSASTLNQIIQAEMDTRSQPLARLKTQKDNLEVQRAVYVDLQTQLGNLKDAASALLSTNSSSAINQKTLTSSNTDYVSATASSNAGAGVYTLSNVKLAQAHVVASARQVYANQSLGITGTFYLGGAATASVGAVTGGSNTVAAFDTGSVKIGQTQLGTDDYSVELRTNTSGAVEFRLVNKHGEAQNIADAGSDGTYTDGWQALGDVKDQDADGNYVYDTGRGMKIKFASNAPTVSSPILLGTAASGHYTAQGARIDVTATNTLQDIRAAINSATYADGNGVQASVVDNQLVLTAETMGADHKITGADSDGVLQKLGMYTLAEGQTWNGATWGTQLQEGKDGSLTINNINVTGLESNTGLTNVISGVTLNLKKATDSTTSSVSLTVNNDNAAVTSQINAFITQFNATTKYLDAKTAVTQNSDGKTYTAQALAGDTVFQSLKIKMISDMSRTPAGLSPTAPKSLADMGLSFDADTMQLKVSDSSKLQQALSTNRSGVSQFFDGLLSKSTGLLNRINMFTGDTSANNTGILAQSITTFDKTDKLLASEIDDMNTRLTAQETQLTNYYSSMLAQLADMQNQASYVASLLNYTG